MKWGPPIYLLNGYYNGKHTVTDSTSNLWRDSTVHRLYRHSSEHVYYNSYYNSSNKPFKPPISGNLHVVRERKSRASLHRVRPEHPQGSGTQDRLPPWAVERVLSWGPGRSLRFCQRPGSPRRRPVAQPGSPRPKGFWASEGAVLETRGTTTGDLWRTCCGESHKTGPSIHRLQCRTYLSEGEREQTCNPPSCHRVIREQCQGMCVSVLSQKRCFTPTPK